jgi:hypothetical protein
MLGVGYSRDKVLELAPNVDQLGACLPELLRRRGGAGVPYVHAASGPDFDSAFLFEQSHGLSRRADRDVSRGSKVPVRGQLAPWSERAVIDLGPELIRKPPAEHASTCAVGRLLAHDPERTASRVARP